MCFEHVRLRVEGRHAILPMLLDYMHRPVDQARHAAALALRASSWVLLKRNDSSAGQADLWGDDRSLSP